MLAPAMAQKIRTLLLASVVILVLTRLTVVVLSVSRTLALALAHAQKQGHYFLSFDRQYAIVASGPEGNRSPCPFDLAKQLLIDRSLLEVERG